MSYQQIEPNILAIHIDESSDFTVSWVEIIKSSVQEGSVINGNRYVWTSDLPDTDVILCASSKLLS